MHATNLAALAQVVVIGRSIGGQTGELLAMFGDASERTHADALGVAGSIACAMGPRRMAGLGRRQLSTASRLVRRSGESRGASNAGL